MSSSLPNRAYSSSIRPQTIEVKARLGGIDHVFMCPAGSNLLEAALDAGLMVPHSCREGHCGACITQLTGGTVSANPGAALSRRDRLQRRILSCQSCPTSASVAIDYDA